MGETGYRCVHGHDRCGQSYAGPDCPYCEPDTSDIPEADEAWFARARLTDAHKDEHLRIAAEAEAHPLTGREMLFLVCVVGGVLAATFTIMLWAALGVGD